MDDPLPLDDFSTVSIARQFPQLSPRERYLAPVSVLPFINSRPASPSFPEAFSSSDRLELMPTTVLSVPRGLTALSGCTRGHMVKRLLEAVSASGKTQSLDASPRPWLKQLANRLLFSASVGSLVACACCLIQSLRIVFLSFLPKCKRDGHQLTGYSQSGHLRTYAFGDQSLVTLFELLVASDSSQSCPGEYRFQGPVEVVIEPARL